MNLSMFLLLESLILLLNCSASHGQGSCGSQLQPHFSVYTSIARDGKNIQTSVTTQGYTSISGTCNMNGATHKAGAYNSLGSTGGWNSSGSGCPTWYFSVTNYDQSVGVPGVVYTFNWNGATICSIVGTFWGNGGSGSIVGCLAPSTETTAVIGPYSTTQTAFNQRISDTAGDAFNGLTVTEGNAAPGQDTCWGTWSIGTRDTGVPANQTCTVAGGQMVGQPN